MTKIFLIGCTKTGKGVLAQKAKACLPNLAVIEASGWVKATNPIREGEAYSDYAGRLATLSVRLLTANPMACVQWVKARMAEALPGDLVLIDGVRNPSDFGALFDPSEDYVAFIDGGTPATVFETGVTVIEAHVAWTVAAGLTPPRRVVHIDGTADYDGPAIAAFLDAVEMASYRI